MIFTPDILIIVHSTCLSAGKDATVFQLYSHVQMLLCHGCYAMHSAVGVCSECVAGDVKRFMDHGVYFLEQYC